MPTITHHHYVLAVHNVKESAAFYVDKLGFKIVMEPEGWIFVERDGFWIMLGECPDDMHPSELGCHSYFAYFRVDDAHALYAEYRERGVEFTSWIADKPWGMREFGVRTVDGHRIMFGQVIDG